MMIADLSSWITPAILLAGIALLLRGQHRLEERLGRRIDEQGKLLGQRIDETNKRIDEQSKLLGQRIDDTNQRIDDTNQRIDDTNKRIDDTNKRIDEQGKLLGQGIEETNRRVEAQGRILVAIDDRLRVVEHGQAKLEGLLEGLREAIGGRRPAA